MYIVVKKLIFSHKKKIEPKKCLVRQLIKLYKDNNKLI